MLTTGQPRRSNCGGMTLWQVDQYFVESPNVDDPVAHRQDMRGLQEDVFGYRAADQIAS
jgi:hypothetical protein